MKRREYQDRRFARRLAIGSRLQRLAEEEPRRRYQPPRRPEPEYRVDYEALDELCDSDEKIDR